MEQFVELLKKIIKEGKEKKDRTGTGTISIFGHQSVYDLSKGFPLLTAKHTYTRGIIIELLWFLGNHMKDEKYANLPMTNTKYLVDNNVNIWNEWANKDGNLGSVYGQQWRMWQFTEFLKKQDNGGIEARTGHCDQINWALHMLKTKPEDRGIIVSAWNVGELDHMALRPCHTMFQFYTEEMTTEERNQWCLKNWNGGNTKDSKTDWKDFELDQQNAPKYKLSLQLYQRSADTFLGVPFNIASYSILLHMFAQLSNMIPDKFVHTFGDAHIYLNHKTQVNELLKRISPDLMNSPEPVDFFENKSLLDKVGNQWPELPELWLNPAIKKIEDFTFEDIKVKNYKPFSKIEAPIAI